MAKGKTHRFNTNLQVGKKTYPRGQAVPIGNGDDKVPEADIKRIESTFGVYRGEGETPAAPAESNGVELAVAKKRVAELEGDLKAAQDQITELEGSNKELADLVAGLKTKADDADTANGNQA